MSTPKEEDKNQPLPSENLFTSNIDAHSPLPPLRISKSTSKSKSRIKEEPINKQQLILNPVGKLNSSSSDRKSEASQKDKNSNATREKSSGKIRNIQPNDEEVIEVVDFHTNHIEVQNQALAIFIPNKIDVFTCPICYIDYIEADTAKSLKCNHKFCNECLELYIKAKIDIFQLIDIKCPKDGCKYIINQAELMEILDQATYEKYQTLLDIKLKNKAGNRQYCPKPGCARQLKITEGQEFTKCECGTIICTKCLQPKHDGKSCSQVLKEREELFNNNKNAKMCIVCKSAVEKWTGCSHIRCPVCDYEWCWDCGREWGPGHGRKCTHIWDPEPPGAFSEKAKPDIFTQFMLAAFLLLEMIFCYIVAMLGVLFMWPFAACVYFSQKAEKMKCLKIVLGFIGGVLTWPLATLIVPLLIVIEEYCTCCRFSRRWLRGNVNTFGLGRHKASESQKAQKNKIEKLKDVEEGQNKGQALDRQGLNINLDKVSKKQEDGIDLESGRNI